MNTCHDEVLSCQIEQSFSAVMKILNCSHEDIHNRNFLLQRAKEYGIIFSGWPWPSSFISWQNRTTDFGLLQIPSEIVDFSMYISQFPIQTMLEIGVFSGSTSYFIAAILQRINPKIKYTMLDIEDHVIGFKKFSSILNIEKMIPATSDDVSCKEYDFVFIDADHSYNGVLKDYINSGQYCNIGVAFHDIYAHEYDNLDGGTVRFWNDFRKMNILEMSILEFSHSIEPWMGIGVGMKKLAIQ